MRANARFLWKPLLETPVGQQQDTQLVDLLEDGNATPEEELNRNQLHNDLEILLDELSSRESTVIQTTFWLRRRHSSIADSNQRSNAPFSRTGTSDCNPCSIETAATTTSLQGSGLHLTSRFISNCKNSMPKVPSIQIGIPADKRQAIANGLGRVLADTYVLYGKTHGFHWNVTGPMFNTLHLMFMEQYTELWNALDEIAERIRALGFPAPFGGDSLGQLASIKEAKQNPAALDMVRELVSGHEEVARTAREVFKLAEEANDQPTADLLTQRLQIHEKTAWMLRSLLEV